MRKADWLIGALIALLILFGFFYFKKTYNTIQSQDPNRPSVAETLTQGSDSETATLDEEDEYDEEEYPDDVESTNDQLDEPTADDLADLNKAKAQAAAQAAAAAAAAESAATGKNSNSSSATPNSYDNAGNANGKYLVVAGTFKQEANAQVQLKKFKKLGYADAEIGKFNKSAYASLIVNRFTSSAEAKTLVKTLKRKGIDAYVHEKR